MSEEEHVDEHGEEGGCCSDHLVEGHSDHLQRHVTDGNVDGVENGEENEGGVFRVRQPGQLEDSSPV